MNLQKEKSRYPGALPSLLENFRPAVSPDPTDCPWVSEDAVYHDDKSMTATDWLANTE